jgi:hypothetical protein
MGAFNRFSQVKFAFLSTLSGWHNFLYSYGMIYEVHWDQQGSNLYERSSFYNWRGYTHGDLSGIAMVPPDINFESDPK